MINSCSITNYWFIVLLWAYQHVPLCKHSQLVHRTTHDMWCLSRLFLNSEFGLLNNVLKIVIQSNWIFTAKSFENLNQQKKWFRSSIRSCLSCQILVSRRLSLVCIGCSWSEISCVQDLNESAHQKSNRVWNNIEKGSQNASFTV